MNLQIANYFKWNAYLILNLLSKVSEYNKTMSVLTWGWNFNECIVIWIRSVEDSSKKCFDIALEIKNHTSENGKQVKSSFLSKFILIFFQYDHYETNWHSQQMNGTREYLSSSLSLCIFLFILLSLPYIQYTPHTNKNTRLIGFIQF